MEKIIKQVKKAYSKVPYYYNLSVSNNINIDKIDDKNSFEKLPLIEKEYILDNVENMISLEYEIGNRKKDIFSIHTSGTSGECLNIFWTEKNISYSLIDLWIARRKRYGILTMDRCCSFYYSTIEKERLISGIRFTENNIHMAFDRKGLDEKKMPTVYRMIYNFNPKWIMMWPSTAIMLMRCMKKYKLPIFENLAYIELTGEFVSKEIEKEIKEFFQCDVANQYGTTETNSIAYECKCGNLHCMSSNVYIEIIKDGQVLPYGEYGNVYVTTLKNDVMPFIRYSIGDTARLIDGRICECGNKNPIIEIKNSRNTDWVYHRDGEKTSAYELIDAMDSLNDRIWLVRKFQISQNDYEDFSVTIQTSSLFKAQQKITSKHLIKGFLGRIDGDRYKDCVFNFNFCDEIELELNNKFKNFISINHFEDEHNE